MYFVWYDDNPKKSVSAKIGEAILRYKQKYGKNPKVCMLNEGVQPEDYTNLKATANLQIMPVKHIRQNYFWISMDS